MTTQPKYRFPFIFMVLLALTPMISMYIPRFLAFWPLIIGLCTSYWLLFIRKELFRISRTYYLLAGSISFICLLSSLWSISPMDSLEDAIKVTIILMFGGLLVSSLHALEYEDFKPHGWLLPVGIIVAALFCAYDLSSDLTAYRLIHSPGEGEVSTAEMNRGIICCVFAFILSMPLIQNLGWSEKRKFFLIAATAVAMVVMLSLSQSQSGQVAFALGLVMFYLFPTRWKLSYIFVGTVLVVAMLLTPFIVTFLYDLLIDQSNANAWLKAAFVGDRVEIWNFVTKYAMNNPVYGYGMEATNYVPHFDFDHIYNKLSTILHPHNFSVQIWMEFGLFGVLLFATIINTVLYMVYKVKDKLVRKSLTVLFIVVILIASMTYGIWQSWWVGELLLLIGLGAFMSNMRIDTAIEAAEKE